MKAGDVPFRHMYYVGWTSKVDMEVHIGQIFSKTSHGTKPLCIS